MSNTYKDRKYPGRFGRGQEIAGEGDGNGDGNGNGKGDGHDDSDVDLMKLSKYRKQPEQNKNTFISHE